MHTEWTVIRGRIAGGKRPVTSLNIETPAFNALSRQNYFIITSNFIIISNDACKSSTSLKNFFTSWADIKREHQIPG